MSRNLLDQETSPYLLLHKDNPVHWRPWGPEALDEAAESGKPILLSIGYTACHWCHVMNAESFADPETAALMNEHFINIKVDREERPDLDQIYQTAANALGHAGGWPLTMFLTPRGEPFLAGSYFPRDDRAGQPSFRRVLPEVVRLHNEQPEPVANTIGRVQNAFTQLWGRDLRGNLDATILDTSAVKTAQRYDIFYGGITGTPKFPTTGLTEMLWRGYLRTGAAQFAQLVQTTLDNICLGRPLRSRRRWLLPLFYRRTLVRPAFRKNALRQCAADRSALLSSPSAQSSPLIMSTCILRHHRLAAAGDEGRETHRVEASMQIPMAKKGSIRSGPKRRSMPH